MNACSDKAGECGAVNYKRTNNGVWACFLQEPGYGPMYDFDSTASVEMCCLDKNCPGNPYLTN